MVTFRHLVVSALCGLPYSAAEAQQPLNLRLNPTDGLQYVLVPSGSFEMGCVPNEGQCDPDAATKHVVKLSRAYWMSTTEVTVKSFGRFVAATGYVTDVEK